ncbi:hypothetical protein Ahy_B06g084454 [Arachis hypogaea]|uniref:PPM-type phosphatase domain-containing protein n=2 Tax=Arachis TaxID=3817 RepID=A0A444YRX7_ARAHY|nr:hypothetical protein Ahy_B06g084454 [Arachis hypogaea]
MMTPLQFSTSSSSWRQLLSMVCNVAAVCDPSIAVSRDHKPEQTDERQRIENAGTWRVGGVLAVSHAFGDRLLKQKKKLIALSTSFLFFSICLKWEAVAIIKKIDDAEKAAKKLMQEAYQRGSSDNTTCVVVRFLTNQGAASGTSSG